MNESVVANERMCFLGSGRRLMMMVTRALRQGPNRVRVAWSWPTPPSSRTPFALHSPLPLLAPVVLVLLLIAYYLFLLTSCPFLLLLSMRVLLLMSLMRSLMLLPRVFQTIYRLALSAMPSVNLLMVLLTQRGVACGLV